MLKMHLFLVGDIGTGKSTLLRQNIINYTDDIGGFFTQRVIVNNEKIGHRLCSIDNNEPYLLNRSYECIEDAEDVFIYKTNEGKYVFEEQIFIDKMMSILNNITNKKIILLDEIGGVEIRIPVIMNRLLEILDGSIPVIGVIKSSKNLSHLKSKVVNHDITDDFTTNYQRLIDRKDIEILDINITDKKTCNEIVRNFINKNMN